MQRRVGQLIGAGYMAACQNNRTTAKLDQSSWRSTRTRRILLSLKLFPKLQSYEFGTRKYELCTKYMALMEVHSTHTIEERVDRLDPRVKICQKLQGNRALGWAFPHPAKELARVIVAPKVASRKRVSWCQATHVLWRHVRAHASAQQSTPLRSALLFFSHIYLHFFCLDFPSVQSSFLSSFLFSLSSLLQ
jgi:hypothetical protein